MSTILVTGGTGFVASHLIVQLLAAGHTVRTTVRSKSREPELRELIRRAGGDDARLSVFVADLGSDAGWGEAVRGCEYVQHVASPLPAKAPKHEDEVIIPARDGALRVLRAARDAGVRRVVFTSTCGAIYYGHPSREAPFDETSWTSLDGEMSAYVKSKVLAERAVWDFMAREGGTMELAVVNPAGIFGPTLGKDVASSLDIIARLLRGMPGCPDIYFGIVDVRDVADLHVRAMTHPDAAGQRFIAVSGRSRSMLEVGAMLREHLGPAARKVPTRRLPSWLVRFIARFDGALRQLVPMLGKVRNVTSAKAERVLGWRPRPADEAIAASGRSMIEAGVVT